MSNRTIQEDCSHSFNCDGFCEYCGISEHDYESSCCSGEEIGRYE
jgi:hypothetical protein